MNSNKKPIKQKQKYSCLNPEELDIGKFYTFSYNPDEQPLFEKFYKCKLNNLSDWSHRMLDIFKNLKYANIEVNLECSRKGRFHYHGLIRVTKPIEFVIHDLKMLGHYGTYEIDQIDNFEKWRTYCDKQQQLIKPYAEKNDMLSQISTFND